MGNKVLVAGATGIVGQAAVEHFSTLDDWDVVAVSRRPPELQDEVERQRIRFEPSNFENASVQ